MHGYRLTLKPLYAVVSVLLGGCADPGDKPTFLPDTAASTPSNVDQHATASGPTPPSCIRPFREENPLQFPEPFAAFTPCDVIAAMFPDFEPAHERSSSAGGTVRLDRARRWDSAGRVLLAVTYYVGEDADTENLCGGCRVNPQLAIFERNGTAVSLVARTTIPGWDPYGLFNGQADFDSGSFRFEGDESLLGMRTPWSYGMMGHTIWLDVYRLNGGSLSLVYRDRVEWAASSGTDEDDDFVMATVTQQRRHKGPDDILVKVVEAACHWKTKKVCQHATPKGTQRWRFNGTKYAQVEGPDTPMPRLFHVRWGW